MAELTPSPSINDARTRALLALVGRLSALDLAPVLIYRIDSVVADALPFLGWQFDILSPLWQLAAPSALSIDTLTDIDSLTDIDTLSGPESVGAEVATNAASERELLKLAIALHRERGTPGAIKRALGSLGWTSVAIMEGESNWGGTAYPVSEGWAVFRILINLQSGATVPAGAAQSAIAAVKFFQPARTWLDSIWFITAPVRDTAPSPYDRVTLGGIGEYQIDSAPWPSDARLSIGITTALNTDTYGPVAPLYDAHYVHSGITYGTNEPSVADRALIVNGIATLNGG
jgi:P2-related tail formation protein